MAQELRDFLQFGRTTIAKKQFNEDDLFSVSFFLKSTTKIERALSYQANSDSDGRQFDKRQPATSGRLASGPPACTVRRRPRVRHGKRHLWRGGSCQIEHASHDIAGGEVCRGGGADVRERAIGNEVFSSG